MSRMGSTKASRRVRRQFSEEFKAGAVRLVIEEGKTNVGNTTSRPSARTRGRRMATLRPPSTTSLGTVPARAAARSD